jgi:Zn-finger nucleic acid-binding protein
MEHCPNCKTELVSVKFSDLESCTYDKCFDVIVTFCPNCDYVYGAEID